MKKKQKTKENREMKVTWIFITRKRKKPQKTMIRTNSQKWVNRDGEFQLFLRFVQLVYALQSLFAW